MTQVVSGFWPNPGAESPYLGSALCGIDVVVPWFLPARFLDLRGESGPTVLTFHYYL